VIIPTSGSRSINQSIDQSTSDIRRATIFHRANNKLVRHSGTIRALMWNCDYAEIFVVRHTKISTSIHAGDFLIITRLLYDKIRRILTVNQTDLSHTQHQLLPSSRRRSHSDRLTNCRVRFDHRSAGPGGWVEPGHRALLTTHTCEITFQT